MGDAYLCGKSGGGGAANRVKFDNSVAQLPDNPQNVQKAVEAAAGLIGGITSKKTATFVIGTSTSGHKKSDCDYLCDGTADEAEINAAIQALPIGGGEILILEGTYNVISQILVDKDGVTISGLGESTILSRTTGVEYIIRVNNRYCMVEKMCFKSTAINGGTADIRVSETGEHATIKKCFFFGSVYDGVYLGSAVLYVNITNNVFMPGGGTNSRGIGGHDIKYCTISGNKIIGGGHSGLNLFGVNGIGNVVKNNTILSSAGTGMAFSGGVNFLISGNVCLNNKTGIVIGTNPMKNSVISENVVSRGSGLSTDYASDQYTIQITGSQYNLYANNSIMGKNYVASGNTGDTFANNKYN